MNYLWEVALKADDRNRPREQLHYRPGHNCSPYIEASFTDLNEDTLTESIIEANPIYRFSSVFSKICNINVKRYPATREILFDVFMQYMIQLDLRQGLCKTEYYLRSLLSNLLNGVYGNEQASGVKSFSHRELRGILTNTLLLFRCSSSVALFRRTIRMVYPDSLVYSSNDHYRELLIYIGIKENEKEQAKINFLTNVFLPMNYTIHLFWDHHFGIIDVEETMILDEMVLF